MIIDKAQTPLIELTSEKFAVTLAGGQSTSLSRLLGPLVFWP
jgi:hypothetical protein